VDINAYRILMGKPEAKGNLLARRNKLEGNISVKKLGWEGLDRI
jgi:hypothetical protein